jgi:hypothetical protein
MANNKLTFSSHHKNEQNHKMPIYTCTCGKKILIAPDIAAMNNAIKNHLVEHEKVTQKKLTEQALTEKILISASAHLK